MSGEEERRMKGRIEKRRRKGGRHGERKKKKEGQIHTTISYTLSHITKGNSLM